MKPGESNANAPASFARAGTGPRVPRGGREHRAAVAAVTSRIASKALAAMRARWDRRSRIIVLPGSGREAGARYSRHDREADFITPRGVRSWYRARRAGMPEGRRM